MTVIEAAGGLAELDAAIEALPNSPAVFTLWPREGEPYLSKTGLLRRRLLRLLREREKPSRLLNLRQTVAHIEYQLTGSPFESSIVIYEQARRLFPERYLDLLKLRMPPYVKIVLGNEYPRSHVTTHLTRTAALYFGPIGTLLWTALASLAYLSYLFPALQQYELTPSGISELAIRILFFFFAALLVNRFVMENCKQLERYQALSAIRSVLSRAPLKC